LKARGFTLVEVLVALVIVAAGASAVLSSLNSAATSTVYLRDKTFAQWIADNRIAETRLATAAPQNGKTEGELDYAGRRWKWRQQITDADFPGMRRIDVSVRPVVPGAPAPATDSDEDWTITLSGILGRDIAPPGGSIDWEPPPASAQKAQGGAADATGNGSRSGAAAGSGAAGGSAGSTESGAAGRNDGKAGDGLTLGERI
jgi:general secretion pathway protein I